MLATFRGTLGESICCFIEQRLPSDARDVRVAIHRLCGGLSSDCVVHVCTRFVRESSGGGTTEFVLKRLDGNSVREARVYALLLSRTSRRLAPLLYDVGTTPEGALLLCLEAVTPISAWPWADLSLAQEVLERVGVLHDHAIRDLEDELDARNYERELDATAQQTMDLLEARASSGDSAVRRSLPAARRIRSRLPDMRCDLQSLTALPPSMIHGDLHPGNVVVRCAEGSLEPILIDWARCRLGSPLEDVASWLQWLGFWEPQVRRKHDMLLGAYLSARGLPRTPSPEVRHAYWIAAALNCYAGVIAYQLSVTRETHPSDERHWRALCAVYDCLRVIRCADRYLRR